MNSFLVKLANLLDNLGHQEIATDLDTIIEKMADRNIPLQHESPRAPQNLAGGEVGAQSAVDKWLELNKSLKAGLIELKNLIKANSAKDSQRAAVVNRSLDVLLQWVGSLARNGLTADTIDMGDKLWSDTIVGVFKPIEEVLYSKDVRVPEGVKNRYHEIKNGMKPILNGITALSSAAKAELSPSSADNARSLKAPQQNRRAPNKTMVDIIKAIQGAVGVEQNGRWTSDTNKAFIAYMNEHVPASMENNVFMGLTDESGKRGGRTLYDAWKLIQDSMNSRVVETKETSHTPVVEPLPEWTSRHFTITPAAQNSLAQIEKIWPGSSQKEIDTLDAQKSGKGVGQHMDQETFEEMLAGRAVPRK